MEDLCMTRWSWYRSSAGRNQPLRMDRLNVSMGTKSQEEGGPPGTNSTSSDASRRRLGPSPLPWDHLHGVEWSNEETGRQREVRTIPALRGEELNYGLSVTWTQFPLEASPVGPTEVIVDSPTTFVNKSLIERNMTLMVNPTKKRGTAQFCC